MTSVNAPSAPNAPARHDVYGVGSVLVDTEALVDDAFLAARGFEKGIMTLAPAETLSAVLADLSGADLHRSAGGSVANTMAGVAQFGGRAFFAGKSGADMNAALYRESLAEAGVAFDLAVNSAEPTGVCLALVTPDGERTMLTSLGAAATIGPADVAPEHARSSAVVYVEGYLIGAPDGPDAIERVMRLAVESGARVALSLSDPALAAHFADPFRRLAREYVDILFCNEQEAEVYTGGGDVDGRLRALGQDAPVVFMTRGADGATALDADGGAVHIPGRAVPVVDTTGAGDAFAAGALYGLTHSLSPADAAKLGVFASAKVVTAFGARLKEPPRQSVAAILAGASPTD